MTENWMNPMNRILWLQAFRSRSSTVTLRDGRKFAIDYEKRGSEGMVWVEPVGNELVPCGYFVLKDVTHLSWVSDAA